MSQDIKQTKSRLKEELAKKYYPASVKSNSSYKEQSEKQTRYSSLLPLQHRENSFSYSARAHQEDDNAGEIIRELSFSHHNPDSCMCESCNCGRHLCKLTPNKPDLKKQTIYQTTFKPQQYTHNPVIKAADTDPLKGTHLDLKTQYLKQYNNRKVEKIEKPKPTDTLMFAGPTQTITTYTAVHPGHKGGNQYVKPTDKHRIGEYPLLGKSIYSTEFVTKRQERQGKLKNLGSLRTGQNWMGSSTYSQSFRRHNPEEVTHSLSNPIKMIQPYEKKTNFNHQFRTIYKSQFQPKVSPLCPSKIQLDRSESPEPGRDKNFFRQNSDFRSMSPELKPFSTSKHFYV